MFKNLCNKNKTKNIILLLFLCLPSAYSTFPSYSSTFPLYSYNSHALSSSYSYVSFPTNHLPSPPYFSAFRSTNHLSSPPYFSAFRSTNHLPSPPYSSAFRSTNHLPSPPYSSAFRSILIIFPLHLTPLFYFLLLSLSFLFPPPHAPSLFS